MGQNPTSGVLSLQRRRDIYAICQKYDILIVEDDPYWYLQYPSATAMNTTTSSDPSNLSFNPHASIMANGEPRPDTWKSSGFEFLDSLVPSSVSIDTDGRVIRLDTFSKTVAPGCRLGWITAQPNIIERLLRITESSTQQPSGFVQSMIGELLLGPDHNGIGNDSSKRRDGGKGGLPDGRGWKVAGWIRWIEGLRGNYERRMKDMCHALDAGKHAVKAGRRNSLDDWAVVEKVQIYDFEWPVGGMFIWLKVLFDSHPLHRTYRDAAQLARLSRALWIFWTTKPYLILVSPGLIFSPTEEIRDRDGYKYFRLCFAAINEDEVAPTTQRLVDGAQAFWRIKDKAVIENLLEEDEAAGLAGAGAADLAQMIGPC